MRGARDNEGERPSTGRGGAEEDRTPDLCSAIAALSHLSYSPAPVEWRPNSRALAGLQRPCRLLFQLAATRRRFAVAGDALRNATACAFVEQSTI